MRISFGAALAAALALAGCLYSPLGLNQDNRLYPQVGTPQVGTNGQVSVSFPAPDGASQAKFSVPDTAKVVPVTATPQDGLFTATLVFPSPAAGSTDSPLFGFFPVEVEIDGQPAGNLAVFNLGTAAAAAAAAQRRSAQRRAAP